MQQKRHAGDEVLNKTALHKTRHSFKGRKMSLKAARLLALLCMRGSQRRCYKRKRDIIQVSKKTDHHQQWGEKRLPKA